MEEEEGKLLSEGKTLTLRHLKREREREKWLWGVIRRERDEPLFGEWMISVAENISMKKIKK